MTARRDFLKGAAASGIFFCGCALLRAAQAQSSTARALPVMVNGKRVKTIDVHSHCPTEVTRKGKAGKPNEFGKMVKR